MNMPTEMFKLDDEDSVLEQHVDKMTEHKFNLKSNACSPMLKKGMASKRKVRNQEQKATHHSQSAIVSKKEHVKEKHGETASELQSKKDASPSDPEAKAQSTLLNEASLSQQNRTG